LLKLAAHKSISKSFEELCKDRTITKIVLDHITQQGKQDGLLGFELAKKLTLSPVSFATYGIFTSTMKLQRKIA